MLKRLIVCLLIAILTVPLALTACTKEEPIKILFLGDSIAEGIIGPSPISERERYAYYGVLGQRNGYYYKNLSVSGHQTKDMLAFINQEDTDARMIESSIKEADVIHVSIIGNDLLQTSLGNTLLEFVNDNFTRINGLVDKARLNFAAIVERIRELNPDATLFFQTVYNPAYPETPVIAGQVRDMLLELGIEPEDYREISASVLGLFNNIINDYLIAHPGEFYVLDGMEAFGEIHDQDEDRGRRLIASDGIHPSPEGHAVLADYTQRKLEALGLADAKKAVKEYKKLRTEQLERLYGDSVDIKAAKKKINKATTCAEITKIYFEEILGKSPKYFD